MADNNEIIFSVGFDPKKLDSQIKKFAKDFKAALRDSLEGFTVNLNKVKTVGKLKVELNLDLSSAKKQIKDFQDSLLTNPIKLGVVAVQPQKASFDPTSIKINQGELDKTGAGIKQVQSELRGMGLSAVEVTKQTGTLETRLRGLQKVLSDVAKEREATRLSQGAAIIPPLTDNQILRLNKATIGLKELNSELQNYSTRTAAAATDTQRVDKFMESFGFKVGILGFSLSIFGGQLRRLSQFMIQFGTDSAKATEPVERMHNLVTQFVEEGRIDPNDKNNIFNRINQLADLPGSSLDAVAQSFRQLNSLGLAVQDTLQLIEGLTKAAARTGTGGQGVERLTEQLRQFATSGIINQRDIRTISEQGGTPVLKALQDAFGDASPETLNAAGPKATIKAISDGLKALPAPLEATSDKLNKINNSFIRIRETLSTIIRPGLDKMLDSMKQFEAVVAAVSARFEKLSPNTKNFIGEFIVAIPIIAGALSSVLAVLGTLAIAIAASRQLWQGYQFILELVAKATGGISSEVSIMAVAFGKLKGIGLTVVAFFKALYLMAGSVSTAFNALKIVSASVLSGFLEIIGLTNPIGLIINVLIAYATNLGKARDNINTAFGVLFKSVSKLASTLGSFLSGPAAALIQVLNVITEIIGGALGDAVAAIILQFASLIDLINEFFGLFTSPDLSKLQTFVTTLVNLLTGGIVNLSKLFAATLLDILAENLPATLGGGEGGILQRGANHAREEVFGEGNKNDSALAENMTKAADETKIMQASLRESNDLMADMVSNAQKLATSYAKIQADLRIASIKFFTEQSIKQLEFNFERTLDASVEAAERELPTAFAEIARRSMGAVRQEVVSEIRPMAMDIADSLKRLNLPEFTEGGVIGKLLGTEATDRLNEFRSAVADVGTLSVQGKTKLNDYQASIDRVVQAGQALGRIFTGVPITESLAKSVGMSEENLHKLLNDLKGGTDETLQSVNKLQERLGEGQKQEQEISQQRIENEQKYRQAIQERKEALDAADRVQPLKIAQEILQDRLDSQKELMDSEGVSVARLTQIRLLENSIADLERQIADASMLHADELQSKVNAHDAALHSLQLQNAALREMRGLVRSITEDLNTTQKSLEDGLKSLRDLQRERLKNIGGFSNFGTIPDASGQTDTGRLNTQINASRDARLQAERTNLLRSLPATGATGQDVVGKELKSIIESLTSFNNNFEFLLRKFLTRINELAVDAAADLNRLNVLIKAQEAIEGDTNATPEQRAAATAYLATLREQQKEVVERAAAISRIEKTTNDIVADRVSIINEELEKRKATTQQILAELQVQQNLLDLQSQVASTQRDTAAKRRVAPGGGPAGILDVGAGSRDIEAASKAEADAVQRRYDIRVKELQLQKIQLELEMRMAGATEEQVKDALALIDLEISLVGKLKDAQIDNLSASAAVDSINSFKTALESLYNTLSNQTLTDFADALKKATDDITGNFDILKSSAMLFQDVFATAFVGAFQAIGQAWVDFLTNGESFSKGFKKLLGDMLISLGTALIQMSLAALAMAFMQGLFAGGLAGALAEVAAVAPMAAVGIAVGTGLVIAGTLLGGGGGAKATTNTNAANAAATKTGASGDDKFDPTKDPRTIYQKALMAQIQIDVRTDDAAIVKTVIKHVNNNGRLTTLIGNRKLNFGY